MRPGSLFTIFCGVLTIAVLCPLTQFLTMACVNASVETAAPVAWAAGLVFCLVSAGGVFWFFARRRLFPPDQLALFYCMLAVAVPVMNLGLMRPLFHTLRVTQSHFVDGAVNSYRTAYAGLDAAWFPLVPTPEGVAWNQADRVLRAWQRQTPPAARRESLAALRAWLAQPEETRNPLAPIIGWLEAVGPDELAALAAPSHAANWGAHAGLFEHVRELAGVNSARARVFLVGHLNRLSEHASHRLLGLREAADYNLQKRLALDWESLTDAQRAALEAEMARLTALEPDLRAAAASLAQADLEAARASLAQAWTAAGAALPEAERLTERVSLLLRMSQQEREALARQRGAEAGQPNQNLAGFNDSLWPGGAAVQRAQWPWWEVAAQVWQRLPWGLWLGPMLLWALLFSCVFLFLMCVAEWLRRKWVDRENLAFPLVDLIDHVIRPDRRLENAPDPLDPPPRRAAVSPLALGGAALGALLITVEALGHYGFLASRNILFLDLKRTVFSASVFNGLPRVEFVLSPITLGILFLLSIEVSFSIWAVFLLAALATWSVNLAVTEVRDTMYTGFEGGRFFPFFMEQLIGAAVVYAAFLLWRSRPRRGEARVDGTSTPPAPYLPPWWTTAGLWVLPVVIAGLLWHLGVRHAGLLALFGGVVLAQTVASARLRAETGLPATHVSYEFTKLPMIFGLTGATGAKVYASYIHVVFLPLTLLFRTLPQQLENLELARRHRLSYATVAVATALAFATAIGVGLVSFLTFSYALGDAFHTGSFPGQGNPDSSGLAAYPLWVSHFLGEGGLDRYTEQNWLRLSAIGVGAGVVGLLLFLRARWLAFPLHPVGYLLLLLSIYYNWVSYYPTVGAYRNETSWLWGSALVAWLLKSVIVKYGGMNAYKASKPFFIGLAVGAVLTVFAWNAADLGFSLAKGLEDDPGWVGFMVRAFTQNAPFTPAVY